MTSKLFSIMFLLSFSLHGYSQRKGPINIFIEKIERHWKFRNKNDSLILNNYFLSGDTVNIKIILTNPFGSYILTLTNKKNNSSNLFYYKGKKKRFEINKLAEFDTNWSFIKYSYIKSYIPVLVKNVKLILPLKE